MRRRFRRKEKAEVPEEKPGAISEGRGRKSRENDNGASGVTATTETCGTEAEERLMEAIVSRSNMMEAYDRVVSNKGAAGIDGMTTDGWPAASVIAKRPTTTSV